MEKRRRAAQLLTNHNYSHTNSIYNYEDKILRTKKITSCSDDIIMENDTEQCLKAPRDVLQTTGTSETLNARERAMKTRTKLVAIFLSRAD